MTTAKPPVPSRRTTVWERVGIALGISFVVGGAVFAYLGSYAEKASAHAGPKYRVLERYSK